jgi:hypothetical protein
MIIEIDLQNHPTGTLHNKPRKPIDRAAIRRKHRNAYWLTKTLIAKLQRERKARR